MYISNCYKAGALPDQEESFKAGLTNTSGTNSGRVGVCDLHGLLDLPRLWLTWLVGSSALLFVSLGIGIGIRSVLGVGLRRLAKVAMCKAQRISGLN